MLFHKAKTFFIFYEAKHFRLDTHSSVSKYTCTGTYSLVLLHVHVLLHYSTYVYSIILTVVPDEDTSSTDPIDPDCL